MDEIKLKLKNLSVKELLEKEVVKFGKGAHITIPKRHLSKKVIVVIPKGDDNETKNH